MGGHVPPEATRMIVQAATHGRRRLTITGLMAMEWGREATASLQAQMKATIEAETGRPHEWRQLINIDAIELAPVGAND